MPTPRLPMIIQVTSNAPGEMPRIIEKFEAKSGSITYQVAAVVCPTPQEKTFWDRLLGPDPL